MTRAGKKRKTLRERLWEDELILDKQKKSPVETKASYFGGGMRKNPSAYK